MRRDLQEVVAEEVEEEEEEEVAEVVEVVVLEVEEEVEVEASEEGVVVVSEGEDIKCKSWQRNFLHDLRQWLRNLFLEQVWKNWSFYDGGTKMSSPCKNEYNRISDFALKV